MLDKALLPALVSEFAGYLLTVKGRSQKTVDEYCYDLQTFFRFEKKVFEKISTNVPLEEIDISDIDINFIKKIQISDIYSFFEYVSKFRKNSTVSRSRKATTIRMFFRYLTNKKNLLEKNPALELDLPKIKSSLPHYLSIDESIKLLNTIDGAYSERNYAIITLFLNCGLRLSELVGIDLSNIKEDSLTVVGKGNKERTIYLNNSCKIAINRYLKVRPVEGVSDRNALFISRNKKRISPKTVQWLVKKFIMISGLDPKSYSVHKLRHTAATLMYQEGVDIRTLQNVLGHENLATTQIYTHVSDKSMKNAINSNPLSDEKQKEHIDLKSINDE